MGLNVFKWLYQLGVQSERTRIAAHLQNRATAARVSQDIFSNLLAEEEMKKRPSERRLEQYAFDREVVRRVEELINEIFNPNGDWIAPASIMFPEGEKRR